MENVEHIKALKGEVEVKEIIEGLSILNNNNLTDKEKQYILLNSWKLLYTEKPPTPEEFLTYKWIGESSLNVYPHIREIFIEFFNTSNEYRYLYLSTVIGFGKSFLTSLIVLYVITTVNLMKDAKKYFGIDPSSMIVGAVSSFTIAKAKQSLSSTILRIMRNSPKFRQVKFEDRIIEAQEEEYKKGTNKIIYCKASSSDTLFQLSKDIHVVAVSDSNSLLGLNLICSAITELSFFLEAGIKDEDAMAMIEETKGRIFSRFSGHYLGRVVIDSSPFSVKNTLDKKIYITNEIEADKKNMVVKGILHWEVHKGKYPLFYNENKFVTIYRGGEGKPTKEITNNEIKNYKVEDIIKLPYDIYDLYKENPAKVVRDYCGYPSGVSGGLLTDYDLIENIFDKRLKNFEHGINAPESQNSENLIWNKIKDIYFIKTTEGYEFYRHKSEKRWIAIDLALSGDIAGVSMIHPEINSKGEVVIITDFNLPIIPTREKINLDAIFNFIVDLRNIGRLNIVQVNYDGFQSADSIQRLKRIGFNVSRESVDSTKDAYYMMISLIKQGRLKAGRNIFLKNNLKSLIEVEYEKKLGTKVDHIKGKTCNEYNNNWDSSLCGTNAKDISDSLSSAVYTCMNSIDNYIPIYRYTENKTTEKVIEDVIYELRNKHGFIIKNNNFYLL